MKQLFMLLVPIGQDMGAASPQTARAVTGTGCGLE
jgi:hypothetical protein